MTSPDSPVWAHLLIRVGAGLVAVSAAALSAIWGWLA